MEFNIVLRLRKENGKLVVLERMGVYISVFHKGKTGYIKTQYVVKKEGIKKVYNQKGNESYEVKDMFVLRNCMDIIDGYVNKCNRMNIESMDCNRLIEELKRDNENISFSEYANKYINSMINSGRGRPARNYRSALNSLYNFTGSNEMSFSDINSKTINSWIITLSGTSTAKKAYPSAIKAIFESGKNEYNDYDNDIIVIPQDPFRKVTIPKVKKPNKRSIDRHDLTTFFKYDPDATSIFNNKEFQSRASLAKDICMLVLCLAGINLADLYYMDKKCLKSLKKDGNRIEKICYNRKKTKDKRDDSAYIEIEIPSEIKHLFEKYKGEKRLFNFSERYLMEESFCKYVNKGIEQICTGVGIDKFTSYSLRHTWATIAQNKCGATIPEIAFALNHSSGHKITEGYIEIDYSPIDILNRKVIDYLFGQDI